MRRRLGAGSVLLGWLLLAAAASAQVPDGPPPPAGPPYPPPVDDVVVYDYADLFSASTDETATRIIAGIEARTGAEVVVYTQVKSGATTESTAQDAADLIDEWGVGRLGFDDGLAILFNITRANCLPNVPGNGQVQLYAGPGYQATFLSNAERQQVFEQDMLPLLRECDFDGALLAALERIDAKATPEHAQQLAMARFIDAAVGLVLGPMAFLLLVGIAARSWLLYGKDPVYLDSPSIHLPAPPADMTAASAVVLWDGRASRRAVTTALLDLASRGELAFKPEKKALGEKAGIQLLDGEPGDPYVIRNRRRPLSDAENYLLKQIRALGARGDDYLSPTELEGLASSVPKFERKLENHVAWKSWFREPPYRSVSRWAGRGGTIVLAGIIAAGTGLSLPSNGLLILGCALVAAGVVITRIARVMPARTMEGAMLYAMLAAYRRTLQKTMQMARSMNEVVQRAQLPWLETPDQAMVWGVALGLNEEVEEVIKRSVQDARNGATEHNPWVPRWYGQPARAFHGSTDGGRAGLAPGLFSSSAVPNFGGMMAALGGIGSVSASASGWGGGGSGGFSGGSSGGGGGGAGGGF
ncbi:MAG TPA: TPM domain-containing protein [Candidatus Limnocylindrales bacterium]|nr:TPM domain-containing protein [Candidatus Limnocylindrales bacterium]